tara:strand:+ start:199 stop:1095 length:897 start_codon:yes stop_codon:yes gene_type:complete
MTASSSKIRLENSPATTSVVDGLVADSLPLDDRGSAYGHGLFETMLLDNGILPLRQQHSERLLRDAPTLGIHISAEQLAQNIDCLINLLDPQQLSSGIIKIILTAGSGGRGYASPAAGLALPRIAAQYFPLPEDCQLQRQEGIRVTECDYRLPLNPVLAGIKHLNRLDQVMARSEWAEEYEDGIMFAADHQAIETTRANLFIKLATGWVTPDLDQAGVRGVMRQLLVDELFSSIGLKVRQAAVSREQLDSAGEMFSCSSVRGIVPIVAARKGTVDLAIGEDTRALQGALQRYYGAFPC